MQSNVIAPAHASARMLDVDGATGGVKSTKMGSEYVIAQLSNESHAHTLSVYVVACSSVATVSSVSATSKRRRRLTSSSSPSSSAMDAMLNCESS